MKKLDFMNVKVSYRMSKTTMVSKKPIFRGKMGYFGLKSAPKSPENYPSKWSF